MSTSKAALFLLGAALYAQQQLTQVQDTIKDASGQPVSGQCTYQAAARFQDSNQEQIFGSPVTRKFAGGQITLSLVPTDTGTPGPQYYKASCTGVSSSGGSWQHTGNWIVPTTSSVLKLQDIWAADPPAPSISIPLPQLQRGGATTNQAMCWNGSAWAPGSCGGGGGGGLASYVASMSGTSVTVLASTHQLGVNPALVNCRDSSGNIYFPGAVSINGSGDVTISSATSMTGTCILQGNSTGTGEYIATLSGTTVTILESTHGLGVNVTIPTCYDGSGNWFEPGSINVNGNGDVSIASVSSMTGRCILQ